MLPLDLPDWNEGMKFAAAFSNTTMEQANPIVQQSQECTQSARRVTASSQITTNYHQQPLQRHNGPGVLHANGISELPNARDAEYWLRRAAAHEASNQPEDAENVLLEALSRDVKPVTSVAKALHELQKRKESGTCGKGESVFLLLRTAGRPYPTFQNYIHQIREKMQ